MRSLNERSAWERGRPMPVGGEAHGSFLVGEGALDAGASQRPPRRVPMPGRRTPPRPRTSRVHDGQAARDDRGPSFATRILQCRVVPLNRDVVCRGCNVLGCGRATPVVRRHRVPGAAGRAEDDSGHEPARPACDTQHGALLGNGPPRRGPVGLAHQARSAAAKCVLQSGSASCSATATSMDLICPVVSVSLRDHSCDFGRHIPATPSNTPKTVSCNVATPGHRA